MSGGGGKGWEKEVVCQGLGSGRLEVVRRRWRGRSRYKWRLRMKVKQEEEKVKKSLGIYI